MSLFFNIELYRLLAKCMKQAENIRLDRDLTTASLKPNQTLHDHRLGYKLDTVLT